MPGQQKQGSKPSPDPAVDDSKMAAIRTICVFCGSSAGKNAKHGQMAAQLGNLLAERNIAVVYGAGNVGLMGILADACLKASGRVVGIIPEKLVNRELAHNGVTELHVVKTMHERKALMHELSDAFIALSGGVGTLEEFFEAVTWRQLGYHDKPIGLLNVAGFYDGIERFFDQMTASGFLRANQGKLFVTGPDPETLLTRLL